MGHRRAFGLAAAAFLFPGALKAHHLPAEWGSIQAQSLPYVGLDLSQRRYSRQGHSADVQGLELSAERRLWKRVGIHAALPVYRVDEAGQADASGLGNARLNVKATLGHLTGQSQIEENGRTLGLGLGLELPSPNESRGIGADRFALAPFLSGLWGLNKSQLYGSFQYLHGLGRATTPGRPNVTSPGAHEEIFLTAGAAYFLTEHYYLNGALRWALPRQGPLSGRSLAVFAPEFGWWRNSRWVVVSVQLPLSSLRWYDYGVNLKLRWGGF